MTPCNDYISQIKSLMEGFESCFTERGYKYFTLALFGLLFTFGKTSMVRLAEAAGHPEKWKCLSWFFQKGKWFIGILQFELLSLCLDKLPLMRDENGIKTALLGIDDFIVRKPKAPKMEGVAPLFDHSPQPGQKKGPVKGHCWLLLTFIWQPLEWLRFLSFPIAAQLWQPQRVLGPNKYKQLGEIALSLLRPLKDLLAQKAGACVLVCDAFFSKVNFLTKASNEGIEVITRLRCDRVLYEIPGPKPASRPGPDSKYGPRIDFDALLDDDNEVEVSEVFLYGSKRKIEIIHRVARFKISHQILDISIVATRGRNGKLILLLSTNTSRSAKEIIEWYGSRWSIELAIRDMKQGLGLDKYQMRSRTSIERFVHTVMACLTVVQIAAVKGDFQNIIHQNKIPWYPCFQQHTFSMTSIREAIFNNLIKMLKLDLVGIFANRKRLGKKDCSSSVSL